MSFSIVYITHGSEASARELAQQLVAERLAACANIFPIKSMYWWQGGLESEDEWVSIVKTTNEGWKDLETRAIELHPYEVPCLMRIQVDANAAYESWIQEQVKVTS
ncbi:MAG: divalent-cation tolerance protein CutA [Saprospiraceae bacterium]|nr:divalent-cation tolerance protein CutA [Saprospiraceae bacterium]